MKLCTECRSTPWPFVMVTFISGVIVTVTWLVLGLSDIDPMTRIGVSAAAFVAVEGTLVHYVVTCMRRHCRDSRPRIGTHSGLNSRA